MGAHEDNLRGKIALEQLHTIKDVTWPGVQHDIERNHVVEMPEVAVVHCKSSLTRQSSAYGIQRPADEEPVPVAPCVAAYPGRYRAWVLPTSGVAVAVEPLEDETCYLREHRRDLFARQHVEDGELIALTELRRGEFGSAPVNDPNSLIDYIRNRTNLQEGDREMHADETPPLNKLISFVRSLTTLTSHRSYFEGRFDPHEHREPHPTWYQAFGPIPLRRWLVQGTLYRVRPTKNGRRIIEPVLPVDDSSGVGPYR